MNYEIVTNFTETVVLEPTDTLVVWGKARALDEALYLRFNGTMVDESYETIDSTMFPGTATWDATLNVQGLITGTSSVSISLSRSDTSDSTTNLTDPSILYAIIPESSGSTPNNTATTTINGEINVIGLNLALGIGLFLAMFFFLATFFKKQSWT